jgi:hypothetical protein
MASKYIIKIEDAKGKPFRIEIAIPFVPKIGPHRGTWRAIDQGFIRYSSGGTHWVPVAGHNGEGDLYFFLNDYPPFGMTLEKLHNFWGVEDMGVGMVPQDWVLACEPGQVKWEVVKVV